MFIRPNNIFLICQIIAFRNLLWLEEHHWNWKKDLIFVFSLNLFLFERCTGIFRMVVFRSLKKLSWGHLNLIAITLSSCEISFYKTVLKCWVIIIHQKKKTHKTTILTNYMIRVRLHRHLHFFNYSETWELHESDLQGFISLSSWIQT